MTSSGSQSDQPFNDLLSRLLDDELGNVELECLADLLQRDPHARQLYHNHIALHTILRWMDGGLLCDAPVAAPIDQHSAIAGQAPEFVQPLPACPAPVFVNTSSPTSFGYLSSGWLMAYLVATIVVGIGIVIAAVTRVSQPTQIATPSSFNNAFDSQSPIPDPSRNATIVGRVTGMVDCEWSAGSEDKLSSPAFAKGAGAEGGLNKTSALHSSILLGDRLNIRSGLLEITYDSGAKVILQGPVTYKVESQNGGFVSIGKLTGKVEGEDAKGFFVRTPTAVITDLGTEFGVDVAKTGATQAHVFRGVVRVQKANGDSKAAGATKILRENESAYIDHDPNAQITVHEMATKPNAFVRHLPGSTIQRLNLVDVIAGGDGFGKARNRGIDPTTGKISHAAPNTFFPTLAGDRVYHRVEGVPFIDGVFVPDGSTGSVQVDSAGHRFDGFDKTDNLTYGHIWAGGAINITDSPEATRTMLRGIEDYASPGHGLLLLHANSAITFDLQAIRNATGSKLVRFRAVAGNAATMAETKSVYADLWLLVDGKLRFVRRHDAGPRSADSGRRSVETGRPIPDFGLHRRRRWLRLGLDDSGRSATGRCRDRSKANRNAAGQTVGNTRHENDVDNAGAHCDGFARLRRYCLDPGGFRSPRRPRDRWMERLDWQRRRCDFKDDDRSRPICYMARKRRLAKCQQGVFVHPT